MIGSKNDLDHPRKVTTDKVEETTESIGIVYLLTNHDRTYIAFSRLIGRTLKQKKKSTEKFPLHIKLGPKLVNRPEKKSKKALNAFDIFMFMV